MEKLKDETAKIVLIIFKNDVHILFSDMQQFVSGEWTVSDLGFQTCKLT
jgi:hypothetical protein